MTCHCCCLWYIAYLTGRQRACMDFHSIVSQSDCCQHLRDLLRLRNQQLGRKRPVAEGHLASHLAEVWLAIWVEEHGLLPEENLRDGRWLVMACGLSCKPNNMAQRPFGGALKMRALNTLAPGPLCRRAPRRRRAPGSSAPGRHGRACRPARRSRTSTQSLSSIPRTPPTESQSLQNPQHIL